MADMKFYSAGPVREESVSSVTATPSVKVGTRVVHKGEEYVYCYNAGGGTISQGHVVKIVTEATAYSVANTALTDVLSPAVGVNKHASVAAGEYFWAMTKGFTALTPVSALTGDYFALSCGASGMVIQWAATGPTQGIRIGYGLAVNASAAVAGSITNAYINTGF